MPRGHARAWLIIHTEGAHTAGTPWSLGLCTHLMPTGAVHIVGTQTILLVSVLIAKPHFLPVCKIILGTPRITVWKGCRGGMVP